MTAPAIPYDPDPYAAARAIDRALEGDGWRTVVMHAEGAIRIAPRDGNLFGADVLVMVAGEQLVIGEDGLQIVPAQETS